MLVNLCPALLSRNDWYTGGISGFWIEALSLSCERTFPAPSGFNFHVRSEFLDLVTDLKDFG
jgi:hypothetical protein